MPFDASPVDSEVVTVLKKARALIDSPSLICKFHVQPNELGQRCTIGALYSAGDPEIALFFAQANGFPSRADVMMRHDRLMTDLGADGAHKIIMGWFDKAIILAGGTP